jgi:hypothetical protein
VKIPADTCFGRDSKTVRHWCGFMLGDPENHLLFAVGFHDHPLPAVQFAVDNVKIDHRGTCSAGLISVMHKFLLSGTEHHPFAGLRPGFFLHLYFTIKQGALAMPKNLSSIIIYFVVFYF